MVNTMWKKVTVLMLCVVSVFVAEITTKVSILT